MFRSLQAADVRVRNIVKAIIDSENQSLPNETGNDFLFSILHKFSFPNHKNQLLYI